MPDRKSVYKDNVTLSCRVNKIKKLQTELLSEQYGFKSPSEVCKRALDFTIDHPDIVLGDRRGKIKSLSK